MKRERLDRLLLDRGLESSRERARARIMAGQVRVNGHAVTKAGTKVAVDAPIDVVGDDNPYVSRGGLKLAQALAAFEVPVAQAVSMDVGASTGGFTDCVLQHGAARVYAVDVGYGQLAWKLRQDERVVVLERTNVRKLTAAQVPEAITLCVVDCSFIGLAKVLAPAAKFLHTGADAVALVKPQFEVGKANLGKGGVVRDAAARTQAIARVEDEARALGFDVVAGTDCDTHGPKGNIEYLLHLRWSGPTRAIDTESTGDLGDGDGPRSE